MHHGEPELITFNDIKKGVKYSKFKDQEHATAETIRIIGQGKGTSAEMEVNYTYRYKRNPIIGDKFSSRHGQKGVLSVLWP